MINNSLITSFFSSPDHNVSSIQLSLVNTSPILLSPGSLNDLETLTLQDNRCFEREATSPQNYNSGPNDNIPLLSETTLSAGDRSVLIVGEESFVNNEEDLSTDTQTKVKKQSTISNLFLHPPTANDVANEPVPERREKRKAAVKATQQMTQMLSTTRSREDNLVTDMKQRNVVASIFLTAKEKKRLKKEDEKRIETEQKREQEIEKAKHEAFLKFATEPIVLTKPDERSNNSQTQTLTSEDSHLYLWTTLQHVTQLPDSRTYNTYLPLRFSSDIELCCDSLGTDISYNFLSSDLRIEEFNLESVEIITSELERERIVSQLEEQFPSLPVKSLYTHYSSLIYSDDEVTTGAVSSHSVSTESKKRGRQRDTDNPLAFKSKRRKNQFSPPYLSLSSDCLIVDSTSQSNTATLPDDTVLWTDQYLPPTTDLLVSDTNALIKMKEFLKDWQKVGGVNSSQNSRDSSDSKSKADVSDSDDDFENFLKKHRFCDEDTRSSSCDSDNVLTGAMLLTGGVSSGKTSSVYVIAEELDMKVMEINTIMNRSGRDMQLNLSEATQSFRVSSKPKNRSSKKRIRNLNESENKLTSYSSHFNNNTKVQKCENQKKLSNECTDPKPVLTLTDNTIILLDEVDLLFETDRGFWPAFQQIARETKLPIFLTANEADNFEIVPDIFTNHTFFQSIPVTKMSLIIILLFLSHRINITNTIATDIAIYFWPDVRKVFNLLQFWLTPRPHKSKNRGTVQNIRSFLSPFVSRNESLIFNMNTLIPTHSCYDHNLTQKGGFKQARQSKCSLLRLQFRARDIFSSLEVYQAKLTPTSASQFHLKSASLGDGFSSEIIHGPNSDFNHILCESALQSGCKIASKLVSSLQLKIPQEYLDNLANEERHVDRKRIWMKHLQEISDGILEERSGFHPSDFGQHYLPYLKFICVLEGERQLLTKRRHIKKYLSSLTSDLIEILLNSELIN